MTTGKVLALAGQQLQLAQRVAVHHQDVGEGAGGSMTPRRPSMRTISAPTRVACDG
jgi:hypothetical protein